MVLKRSASDGTHDRQPCAKQHLQRHHKTPVKRDLPGIRQLAPSPGPCQKMANLGNFALPGHKITTFWPEMIRFLYGYASMSSVLILDSSPAEESASEDLNVSSHGHATHLQTVLLGPFWITRRPIYTFRAVNVALGCSSLIPCLGIQSPKRGETA